MNREMKFRLRRGNEIVGYEKALSLPKCGWIYSTDNRNWSSFFIPHTDKDQFTSLCDKKGKEGYHKDICRIPAEVIGKSEDVIAVIEWGDGCYYFKYSTDKGDRYCSIGNLPHSVIIGNVFQSPELLEKKK